MRNWRVLTAVAAVVLALVAAVASYSYVTGADKRAASKEETVTILQSKGVIPKNTKGQDAVAAGLVGTVSVPRKLVPPGALDNFDALTDKVTLSDIPQGQFLVADSTFVTPQEAVSANGFAAGLDQEHQAMTIQLDQTRAVGGFAMPGDRVNMIISLPLKIGYRNTDGDTDKTLNTSAYLLPGLKVLAVGQKTVQQVVEGDPNAPIDQAGNIGLLTLEVTPRQALQIAHAFSTNAQLYLTLTPPGFDPDKFEIPQELVEATNLFDQRLAWFDQVAG